MSDEKRKPDVTPQNKAIVAPANKQLGSKRKPAASGEYARSAADDDGTERNRSGERGR